MKPIFLFIALNLSSLFSGEYWQQFVRYQMDVKLDTAAHTIGGHSTIKYVNNSPNELDHIYINLYANAFQVGTVKHREYMAKLGRASRIAKFMKGMEKYLSNYDISNFSIDMDGSVIADTFKIEDTILSADLSQPLAPGDSLIIALDWTQHVGNSLNGLDELVSNIILPIGIRKWWSMMKMAGSMNLSMLRENSMENLAHLM